MEGLLGELEFDVKALFDTHFHFDARVFSRLLADVLHDELLLLRDPVVVAIDHHIDKVAQSHHNPIVRLKLLLHSIE